MTKLGKPYENLLAMIAKALHPGASVAIGEWVEGPDGEREVDVSVRGQIDGHNTFILLECKDWKKPVGIEALDALDSKRHDVGADTAMLASNSGFTASALRKGRRKNIMCVSALAAGNNTIRFVLNREFLAKKLSVERYSWSLYGPGPFPQERNLEALEYKGMLCSIWLRERSIKLLRDNEFATVIHHRIVLKEPIEFSYLGKLLLIEAVQLHLHCKRSWQVQIVREDVSHGLYDHLKRVVLIPDKEFWSLEFDTRNWKEVILEDEPDLDLPLAPNSVQLHMVLFNPIFGGARGPIPPLDELIGSEETVVEPQGSIPVKPA